MLMNLHIPVPVPFVPVSIFPVGIDYRWPYRRSVSLQRKP
jgi:hypothetical protein